MGQLPIPKKLLEKGVRDMVRISDARMCGTSYGACVLHVAPESHVGGPLALVRTGDLIELDVPARRLELQVSDEELAKRRADWQQPPAEVRPRLRRAVPGAHHPGQRGLRLRLPRGRPADPGAGDPLMAFLFQEGHLHVTSLSGKWPSWHEGMGPVSATMIIGGERRPAASGAVDEITSPWDGRVVGTVPRAGPADADGAVAVAAEGAVVWRRTPAHERLRILLRAADLADERTAAIADLISAENGKSIREATVEASRCGDVIRTSAFEGAHLYGESLPLDAAPGTGFDKIGFTVRQPCGVVLAITPFNYPGLLAIHKIAPALAAGNAVVLKPAELTPLTALALADCFLEAGPAGLCSRWSPGTAARSATRWWPTRASARSRSPGRRRWASGSPAPPG